MSSSVRDYAILWVGRGRAGGATALGGNGLLATPQHRLDGPEHTTPTDGTNLDASSSRHGLLPKLSGNAGDVLHGDGTFGAEGGMVPFYIPAAEVFTVPTNRQALYHAAITVDGAIVVDGILIGV